MSPAPPQPPSYASGPSDVPLLGETIGDNLDRTVAAGPGAGGAGRRADRAAVDLRAAAGRRRRAGPGPARGRRGQGRPGGDPGATIVQWLDVAEDATAWPKIGAILVNINPGYRTHELEYVLNQAGISLLVAARSSRPPTTGDDRARSGANCPDLREVILIGSPDWDGLLMAGRTGDPGRACGPGRPR